MSGLPQEAPTTDPARAEGPGASDSAATAPEAAHPAPATTGAAAHVTAAAPEMTYVYAVGRDLAPLEELAARTPGVDGGPLRAVRDGELVALVSSVPADSFDEGGLHAQLEDLARLEALARAHHAVVDAAFAATTVLPMRLATVYLDDSRAREVLVREAARLGRLLDLLDGQVELGLKVYADAAAARRPAAAPTATSPGRAYLQRRRTEQRQSRDLYREAAQLAEEAARLADSLARARVVHRPQQGELAATRAENIANEAYLVPAGSAAAFRDRLTALAADTPGVFVEVTGPWAPYSFTDSPVPEATGGPR